MKLLDYLRSNAGKTVYITGDGDLMMDGELRPLIRNKTPLILEKISRGGKACVLEGKKRYVVPPRNVRIIQDESKRLSEFSSGSGVDSCTPTKGEYYLDLSDEGTWLIKLRAGSEYGDRKFTAGKHSKKEVVELIEKLNKAHLPNIIQTEESKLSICWNIHDRSEPCEYEMYDFTIQEEKKSYADIQDEHLRQEMEKIRLGLPETNEVRTREDFEKYKGQFVIIHGFEWQVERFIAIGKDEWDYLYITFDGREVHTHTILDRIVPLKGYIREEDYSEFIRLAKLNHADFLIDREEVRKNIEKDILGRGKITLMSEIYLEL